jgi:hypothetical protein
VPVSEETRARFRRLDGDGDGLLAQGEVPGRWFERLDADGSGAVTLEEAAAAWGRWGAAESAPLRDPEADTIFARLTFVRDYIPGARDASGRFMGGTEALWLAGHGGRLYAGIGYAQDRPGTDPSPGAQVIRKDGPDRPWQVDHEFGPGSMRVEALVSVSLETDAQGRRLDRPFRALLASASDLRGDERAVSVAVRDDDAGAWRTCEVASGRLGVRALGTHRDRITGVHHVFAGLNRGGVHRGAHDPAAPGGIRWEAIPEREAALQPGDHGGKVYDYSRVLCFAVCDGDLYMAARVTTGADGAPVDGGLYRRIDGPTPRWELVHRWPVDGAVLQSRFLRGLTTVPHPADGSREVLLAAFEYPGTILRFVPSRADGGVTVAMERELDLRAFFDDAWHTPGARRRGAIAAYNRFLPVTDPQSGAPLWLCGAWVERPGTPEPPHNGSCYLIRHRDGRYDWGYVQDAARPLPAGQRLTGTRDIEPSPFSGEEGRVLYFCGYDGGAGPSHNTAWIYRGEAPREGNAAKGGTHEDR